MFGTGGIHFLLPGDDCSIFVIFSVAQEKKIKYYHLMTIPTDRRKLLLGKIIYIGYMILFSNVIVFAGATLGGFLLTTHVPVGGALIAVLFLTVSELWEIPVALFLSERFGMIVNLFVCLFITVSGVVISQTRIWYVLVSAIPMRMMCPLLHVFYQMDLPQKQGILFWIRESLFRECVSQSSGLFL